MPIYCMLNVLYRIHLKNDYSGNKIKTQQVTLVKVCNTTPAKIGEKYLPGQLKPTAIILYRQPFCPHHLRVPHPYPYRVLTLPKSIFTNYFLVVKMVL